MSDLWNYIQIRGSYGISLPDVMFPIWIARGISKLIHQIHVGMGTQSERFRVVAWHYILTQRLPTTVPHDQTLFDNPECYCFHLQIQKSWK